MISGDAFTGVFGMVPAGGTDDPQLPVRVARAAITAGLAVVIVAPGSKAPVCTLFAAQQAQEDRKVQDEAAAAGDPRASRRRHACGIHHALTDRSKPKPATVLARMAKRYPQGFNLGIELGRSRMVVVDVDTAAENEAFLAHWAEAAGGHDQSHRTPTVRSPGSRAADGSWAHSDGGHYWFTLPDGVELPVGQGVLKAAGGWSVMWADHQVLVPPSSRPEGAYQLQGLCLEAPGWLTDMIMMAVDSHHLRRARQADMVFDGRDPIERWSAKIIWADLLEPDGWTDTGLVDTCSCPIWTAPGLHASPKSATAHELGCDRYSTETGWGPLHVWTDNPPEWMGARKTWTKLQFVTDREHSGDAGRAIRELGLGGGEGIGPPRAPATVDLSGLGPERANGAVPDLFSVSTGTEESVPDPERTAAVLDVVDRPVPRPKVKTDPAGGPSPDAPRIVAQMASDIRMRATRWLWAEDGHSWVPLGGMTLLAGREGAGKSTVAYDMAARVSRGTLPGALEGRPRYVIISATEDDWGTTIVPRLTAAGADLERIIRVDVDSGTHRGALVLPQDVGGLEEICRVREVALIILDPLMTTIGNKLDTHKDAEVRQALEPLSRLAHETHAAVIGLIHFNKSAGNDSATRIMGSRAFAAVARAVLVCTWSDSPPAEEGLGQVQVTPERTFLLGQAKNNLAAKVSQVLQYVIRSVTVGHDAELDNEPIVSSRVVFLGEQDGDIDEVIDAQSVARASRGRREPATGRQSAGERARLWLREYLSERSQVPGHVVRQALETEFSGDVSQATLGRAASGLGIVYTRSPDNHKMLLWSLPGAQDEL